MTSPRPPFEFDPKRYPTSAGVYLMRNAKDEVIYVGKAANLRTRLRSYFSSRGDSRPQVRFLLARVVNIDTLVTDTEKEALLLENSLIKKHRPRYNIDLRDDKTYVSLRLDEQEEFPALQVVRRVKQDGATYFGPYSSAGAVRQTLKQIYRIFPLRHYPVSTCRRRGRPCLFHQIGQCCAPCHGRTSAADYRELVKGVVALLSGRETEVIKLLQKRMREAATEMNFEEAAQLRNQILAIEQTVEKQKVAGSSPIDQDVIGIHHDGGEVQITALFLRHGSLLGQRSHTLQWRLDSDELLSAFLRQFYAGEVIIPQEILLPRACADTELVRDWLESRCGHGVRIQTPERGDKKQLVELATRNAAESYRHRIEQNQSREYLLQELQQQLHLRQLPRRIECFDISTLQGKQNVGSMAVLIDGEPTGKDYRRFRIKQVLGADDYAALREVLQRRLQRGLKEQRLPELIMIDGGKGQLGVLTEVLQELGLAERIDAVGIAKSRVFGNQKGKLVERSEERFFRPGRKNPVTLRQGSATLFLLQHLRDEAHRFAITYHRKLRGKAALASPLDRIPGVGPARRKALLKKFGSLKQLRQATAAELAELPGISPALAETIQTQLASKP